MRKLIFVFLFLKFVRSNKKLVYNDLNFRNIDFTNYQQIKLFIFKKKFHLLKNKHVHNFDFLSFTKKLGGNMGIKISKEKIFDWYNENKNKINYPWTEDLTSRRLINLLYNYEYIISSSNSDEIKYLDRIIYVHMQRTIFEFNKKQITEITSFDTLGFLLSLTILNKLNIKKIKYLIIILKNQVDNLGMHKSYNILEHSKFINNLNEIKNIFLFNKIEDLDEIDKLILKMSSILIQYFHDDGSIPLFNGANNNYTDIIYKTLNKEIYLKNREFVNAKNGIAFYGDKNKKLFFDVVQPNNDKISSNLSAGTLSIEFSCLNEKIITNCGASESYGKNPEYLRYSAAHSTIILQNTNVSEIKEGNPHIKYPQSVVFSKETNDNFEILEASHNGYINKFKKIIKRKLILDKKEDKIMGEDSIISINKNSGGIIFHIRFHLNEQIVYNFTNNKKNIILKTKLNQIWLFKSDVELIIEDSIIVDNNTTKPTKQIVIKGIIKGNKLSRKWSLEKM